MFLMMERSKCSGCGTKRDDWMDPSTKRPVDPPPYTPEELRCMGCVILAELREESGKEEGVYVRFIKNES